MSSPSLSLQWICLLLEHTLSPTFTARSSHNLERKFASPSLTTFNFLYSILISILVLWQAFVLYFLLPHLQLLYTREISPKLVLYLSHCTTQMCTLSLLSWQAHSVCFPCLQLHLLSTILYCLAPFSTHTIPWHLVHTPQLESIRLFLSLVFLLPIFSWSLYFSFFLSGWV
jgi:hypothetical protein